MATMSALRTRADELLSQGLTRNRAFRVLRSEFKDAERDQLLRAIPLRGAPTTDHPLWAKHGQALRPVIIRQFGRKKLGGGNGKHRTIRTSPQGAKAPPVLPEVPVDDRRRTPLPASRGATVDKKVERPRKGSQPRRTNRGAGKKKGGGMTASPLTMRVPALEVRDGDWVEGHGIVKSFYAKSVVVLKFAQGVAIFDRTEKVTVRLEDDGTDKGHPRT